MNSQIIDGLNLDEIEFLAENTIVQIIPKFRMNHNLEFISGKFGPFIPSVPTEVPLWLAIQLKKANRCNLKVPNWMKLENLQELYKQEQDDDKFFKPMAKNYLEVASLLLQYGDEDIPNAARIRSILADIESVRMNKIREGLKGITTGTTFIKLNNISSMELNTIQPFCITALNVFQKLGAEEEVPPDDNDLGDNDEIVMDNDNDEQQMLQQPQQPQVRSGRGMHLRARTTELEDEEFDNDNDDVVDDDDHEEEQQPLRKLRRLR